MNDITDEQVLDYCDKHPDATFAGAVLALQPSASAVPVQPDTGSTCQMIDAPEFPGIPNGFDLTPEQAWQWGCLTGWRTASPPPVTAAPTVEQAIASLVDALAESKGWMRGYADSVIRDAIDRTAAREQEGGSRAEEAAEIIGSLISNIESHGMYSKESTLGFLTQAFYCLHPENPEASATGAEHQSLIDWVAEQWHAQVANRPMVNVHRRALDDTWRLMLRHLGVDDRSRLGPTHDELRAEIGSKDWAAMNATPTPTVQAEEPVALLKVGEQDMREWMLMRDLPEGEYRLALIGTTTPATLKPVDAARVRAEALEEAAKLVEPFNMDRPSDWTYYASIKAECANAIRALIGTTKSGASE